MILHPRTFCAGALALAFLLASVAAQAASVQFTVTPFTGDDTEVEITLDDTSAGAGNIEIMLSVTMGLGDLRALFFDVADDTLLSGLMITGGDVTSFSFGDVIDTGRGGNLNGGGTPCPCDVGVALGLPGLRGGSDDLQSVTLVLSHATQDLALTMFSEQLFGVRVTSVGPLDGPREGSSKLSGRAPFIPEPSTALLLGGGLLGLAQHRRFIR